MKLYSVRKPQGGIYFTGFVSPKDLIVVELSREERKRMDSVNEATPISECLGVLAMIAEKLEARATG